MMEEDRTGLCAVRDLAAMMLASPRIAGECVSELSSVVDGKRINVEVAVTIVDGVSTARSLNPKFSWKRLIGMR